MNYKKILEYGALALVILVIGFSINGIATGDLLTSSEDNTDSSNTITIENSVTTHTCGGTGECDGSCGKDPSTCPNAGNCGGSCGGAGTHTGTCPNHQ